MLDIFTAGFTPVAEFLGHPPVAEFLGAGTTTCSGIFGCELDTCSGIFGAKPQPIFS